MKSIRPVGQNARQSFGRPRSRRGDLKHVAIKTVEGTAAVTTAAAVHSSEEPFDVSLVYDPGWAGLRRLDQYCPAPPHRPHRLIFLSAATECGVDE